MPGPLRPRRLVIVSTRWSLLGPVQCQVSGSALHKILKRVLTYQKCSCANTSAPDEYRSHFDVDEVEMTMLGSSGGTKGRNVNFP